MGAKIARAEGLGLQFVPRHGLGPIIGPLRTGEVDGWSIVPHVALALAGAGARSRSSAPRPKDACTR